MPGAPQDFFQWEKERPALNPQFVDGAGPGPAAATNILINLVWEDTMAYVDQAEADVNWGFSGAEWTFLQGLGWQVDGTQIAASQLTRATSPDLQIGSEVDVVVVIEGVIAGSFEIRYGNDVIATGITTSGTFSGTVIATGAAAPVIIEADVDGVGSISYAAVGEANAYRRFRFDNAGPITVA